MGEEAAVEMGVGRECVPDVAREGEVAEEES